MAKPKADFVIGDHEYRFPQSFRLGDPVLVEEITGKEFTEFSDALDDPERRQNPVVLAGLIGVAVWQQNPTWRRDRVRRFVEAIDLETIEFAEPDEDTPADPPPAA